MWNINALLKNKDNFCLIRKIAYVVFSNLKRLVWKFQENDSQKLIPKTETAIIDNIDKFEKIWSDVSFRKPSCAILRMREREILRKKSMVFISSTCCR